MVANFGRTFRIKSVRGLDVDVVFGGTVDVVVMVVVVVVVVEVLVDV